MTLLDTLIKPAHRRILTVTLCAVAGALSACGPAVATGPEEAPGSQQALPFDPQEAVQSMRTASTRAQISPELRAHPAETGDAQAVSTAVAAGNGLYLVVWADYTSSRNPDILGVRVRSSDGALMDASPIQIATGPNVQYRPAVAFDGTNFLVTWDEIQSGPTIYGARVRASDGAVIDTPFLVSLVDQGPYRLPQQQSAVAYDAASGTYLVAWYSYFYENGPVSTGIRGIRIRASDRHIIGTGSSLLGRGGADPRVASAHGYFLVAWTRNVGGTQGNNIEAARMDAYLGTVMDHTPISLAATAANENSPAVASHGGESAAGGEFMVIWTGANNALVGRRLRARDGSIIGTTEFTVGTSAIPNVPAELIFDGQSYQAAWQGTRLGARMALATRISTSGEVNTDDELVLSHVPSNAALSRGGIAATAAGRFVVTYVQYTPEALQRARMRLVVDPLQMPCDSGEPTLVLTGGAVNTLECGSGTYSDPGARAFDGCGNPIPVRAYNTGSDSSGPGPNMRSEGSYTVSYAAWDAQGRTVNASRTVNVDDRTAPTVTLVGPAFMTHTCGSQWQDPGIQALDACYGNVSTWGWRSGEVNGWAEGTYTVTYFVTDGGGNTSAPVTRTVEVVGCPW